MQRGRQSHELPGTFKTEACGSCHMCAIRRGEAYIQKTLRAKWLGGRLQCLRSFPPRVWAVLSRVPPWGRGELRAAGERSVRR